MKQSFLALILGYSVLISAAGQQPTPVSPNPQHPGDAEQVVRITTNLVQVDATVTDKEGKQITDLKPEDFEILEDGRPQKIAHFSYIGAPAEDVTTAANTGREKVDKTAPPQPPEQLRPEQVRRSIALVVDDLGLSFESVYYVRNAIKKFVDQQMKPGDMVAIIRTGAGVGALQQFTTDKQLLYAAIDRIKWNAYGRSGIRAFGNIGDDAFHTEPRDSKRGTYTETRDFSREPSLEARETADKSSYNDYKDQVFTVGTLGALNYVVRGLKELPGRKSAVLMTDSLNLFNGAGAENYRTLDALRRLIDLANRSSVVFYTIDPKGLQALNDSAADSLVGTTGADRGGEISSTGLPGSKLMQDLMSRSFELEEAQNGMNYLANQTGGFLVKNNNDIAGGIRRVLDQKGYYLIGYRPQESTFDPVKGQRTYHKIEVRVKRSGLSVRTRSGFYGFNTETAHQVYRTKEQQLLAALTSPFASGGLDLRLTSVFLNDTTYGSFVRSFIHVSGDSLTFSSESDGSRKATVDVAAVTFDDSGLVVDQRFRTETVAVRGDEYQAALRDGLTFGINLPVKKPGAFQLRIAVRDAATARVGSANQFIAVPDLGKNRLTLSGLYVAGNRTQQSTNASHDSATAHAAGGDATNELAELDAQAGPAVRRFRRGMVIDYGCEAYNARVDSNTGRPQLTMQVRLFRENQQVFASPSLNVTGQPAAKRVVAMGHLQLGQNLTTGDYILQVIVTDVAGKNKPRVASQWIPIEVE